MEGREEKRGGCSDALSSPQSGSQDYIVLLLQASTGFLWFMEH